MGVSSSIEINSATAPEPDRWTAGDEAWAEVDRCHGGDDAMD